LWWGLGNQSQAAEPQVRSVAWWNCHFRSLSYKLTVAQERC